MCLSRLDKRLIKINDPIYGFINIPKGILLNLIKEPYFQRLRYISQMGLSKFVYPGANHTRFEHALGCIFLMERAIEVFKRNQIKLSKEEEMGLYIAILLHDIGHGPFSHALEGQIISMAHEEISELIMKKLNKKFHGALDLSLSLLKKTYPRKFLSQLISSQIDIDRMDYLERDSFYTGVKEGNINSNRIISMFNVIEDELVLELKALHSIEGFLMGRSLMYWQVYLHKTSLNAEHLLTNAIKRAKELLREGKIVEAPKALLYFLKKKEKTSDINKEELLDKELENFIHLDDTDIWQSLKVWQYSQDKVLSLLSKMLLRREFLKVEISNQKITPDRLEKERERTMKLFSITKDQTNYFIYELNLKNILYNSEENPIKFLKKNGEVIELLKIPDLLLSHFNTNKIINKYYFCSPK